MTEEQEQAMMEALATDERIIICEDTEGRFIVDKQRIQAVLLNPVPPKKTIGF